MFGQAFGNDTSIDAIISLNQIIQDIINGTKYANLDSGKENNDILKDKSNIGLETLT